MRASRSAPQLSVAPQLKLFELEPSGEDPFVANDRRRLYRRFDLPPKPQRSTEFRRKRRPPQVLEKLAPATHELVHELLPQTGGLPPSQMARMVRRHRRREERRKRRAEAPKQTERVPNHTHGPELEPLTLKTSDVVAVASSVSKCGSFNNVAMLAASKIEESERLREEQRMRRSEMTTMFKTKRVSSKLKPSPGVITHELVVLQHIVLREQCVAAKMCPHGGRRLTHARLPPHRFLDSLDQLVAGCDQEYKLLQDEKREIQRCVTRELAADVHEANSRHTGGGLPVLIAQLRSVSMDVVEAVVSWRVRTHGPREPCGPKRVNERYCRARAPLVRTGRDAPRGDETAHHETRYATPVRLGRRQLPAQGAAATPERRPPHPSILTGARAQMMTDLLFLDESNAMRHWLCFRASGNPLLIPPPNLDVWSVPGRHNSGAFENGTANRTRRRESEALAARMSDISTFIDMGQESERRRSVQGDAGSDINTPQGPEPAASQGVSGHSAAGVTPARGKPDMREGGNDLDAELVDGEHEIIMLADAIPARQVSPNGRVFRFARARFV